MSRSKLAGIVDRRVIVVVWLSREAKGICLDALPNCHFGDALMLLACEACQLLDRLVDDTCDR
jgi:hypothetical protein